jgi:hypothetical protein
MSILLEGSNEKVVTEDIFKLIIGNRSLYEVSNGNGVKSKPSQIKKSNCQEYNVPKSQHLFPDRKTHSQIHHDLTEKRLHSNITNAQSLRVADY